MYRKTVALVYIIAVATTSSALQLFFPELHRQYNYVIKTNVSTGTLTPKASGSYWTMEGRLVVQVYGNFTRARFRLDNLRTSVYSVNEGYSTYQSKEDTIDLQKPWEADFDSSGFVRYLYVTEEPVWSTNMKRALTINFQLKRNAQSYGNEEPSFYSYPGSGATYLVKGKTIRKYTTYAPTLVNTWSSVPESGRQVNGHTTPDRVTTAERVYELDDRKGLLSLDLTGEFQYKMHEHVLSVVSELSLYYDTDQSLSHVEELNLTQTSVFYQFHGYSNPTNGIRSNSQQILKNRTYEILMKIATTGIDAANVVRNASLIHSMDFVDLLTTMSQLTYISLSKLFEDMVLGTSYDVETARNIFLEVLPHVKTDACARFVKYLVLEQKEKVEDATILSLIRKLPFNVANHSQPLLEELEVFTKLGPDFSEDIRHAGILSFATMVHKALEAWSLKQDYFDIIVVKYFRMYSDCPQYVDRMIWLLGLSNIGFSAEYTRTIYGDSNKARHERLWAALASTGRQNSALETTLPILIDDKEHIQLRIAALHVFLSSHMEASDFLYVHNYIKSCDNNQLKRFWYTTLKSLEKSTYREYRTASNYVPFVSNQISNPDSTYWATNNYIISTKDDKATLHLLSVGEAMSAVPAFIALKLFTGERRSFQIAAYIIAEGVSVNMFKKLHTLDNKEVNVDHLIELLKRMKVEIKEEEKVHIDIVIKIQDKTVYATHVNESRFETWNGEDLSRSIEDFLRFGSHINQQFVYYPSQVDINLPTELGTPIRLQSATVSFTSIRGNLTAPSTQDLTWKNDLHIRYQGTSVTSLSTDGPLLQSEHTARIQQSVVAHIPLNFDVTVSTVAASFALTWKDPGSQNGGVAMHSRAQVITDSEKGTDAYTLTAGEKTAFSASGNGIFFDCERPMSAMELVERLLISNSNSNDFLTSLHPTQILLNALVLLSSPHPGSCGLVVGSRLERNGVLKLELQLEELTKDLRDGGRIKIGHKLSFSDANDIQTNVIFNITGNTQFQSEDGKTTFELLLVGYHPDDSDGSSHIWKICLQQEDITHASPDQDIRTDPASYEGHLSLTFGRNDSTETCPAVGSEFLVFYKGIPTQVYGELERYFELKMVGKELPQMEFLSKTGLSKTVFGQLLSTMNARVPNVTAIVNEKNGVATISVNNGEDLQFNSDNFAWLFDSWSNMQLMKKFGFYRECRLQESTVQTLYGSTEQLSDVNCAESLALADCTKSPRFAVIRLKHGGIRIYAGSTQVVLKGSSGDVKVTIDDEVCTGDCVYPADEPLYDFKITRTGDGVKVISRLSRIQVYYRHTETVILMPHAYMSSACGSCVGEKSYQIC